MKLKFSLRYTVYLYQLIYHCVDCHYANRV